MNAQQLLNQLTQAQTYRDLQSGLKAAKTEGYEIGCKLNANKETLEVARNTLVMEISRNLAVTEPEEADLTLEQVEEVPDWQKEAVAIAVNAEVEQLMDTYTEVLASQGCPEALAAEAAQVIAKEVATGTPRTKEEQATVTAAWEASQSAILEPEPATSIFNPVPAAFQPLVTAKWAWEYASRRASADTALCRRIASDALAAASLALQVASRAVAV